MAGWLLKKKSSMSVLLLGVLLDHLAYYMVLPILPIMLKLETGLSPVQIGIVLGIIAVSFQMGSVLGGFLSDRVGRKAVIGLGSILRAAGLFGFGFFTSYWLLIFTALISGIGGGMDAPSIKASIAALASKENQTTAFSLRGIAANIGTGIAGLIVFFFLTGSTKFIFYVASAIYVALSLIIWVFLPKNCGEEPCPIVPRGAYREVLENKPFLWFAVTSVLIWALYSQLALVLPLRATVLLPEPRAVSLIWTINSFIVIVLQGFVTSFIIRRLHPLTALAFGVLFIGTGVCSLYWSNGFIHLVMSGAIFVIGEMLIMPTIDSTVSQLSKAELVGLFFGITNFVSGLGEGIGNLIGGKLQEIGGYLPWLAYGISGVLIGLIIVRLKRWKPMQIALEEAANKVKAPKHVPKVSLAPARHASYPLESWEPEMFLRKKRG
jgi:MFS family permease